MNIWEILEIAPTENPREIKSAYARLLRKYHPEEYPEKLEEIRQAYEIALLYTAGDVYYDYDIVLPEVSVADAVEDSIFLDEFHDLDEQLAEKEQGQKEAAERAVSEFDKVVRFGFTKSILAQFLSGSVFQQVKRNPHFLEIFLGYLEDRRWYFQQCKGQMKLIWQAFEFERISPHERYRYEALITWFGGRPTKSLPSGMTWGKFLKAVGIILALAVAGTILLTAVIYLLVPAPRPEVDLSRAFAGNFIADHALREEVQMAVNRAVQAYLSENLGEGWEGVGVFRPNLTGFHVATLRYHREETSPTLGIITSTASITVSFWISDKGTEVEIRGISSIVTQENPYRPTAEKGENGE